MKLGRTKFAVGAAVNGLLGLLGLLGLSGLVACDDSAQPPAEGAVPAQVSTSHAPPDARLQTHEIVASTPTAEGLAYIQAVVAAHREADTQQGDARVATLQRGLQLAVPSGLPEAEILRLELASRIASEWIERGRAEQARGLLAPMLDPEHSVPLDRSSAEALVLLGDAAARTGDDALAAGTYARSIRMMSILRQEIER